jgi:hypothetical protein
VAEVIVTVKPNGEVKVHAECVLGPACSLHTKPYVEALGVKVGEEALPEMFIPQQEQEQLHDIGGEG